MKKGAGSKEALGTFLIFLTAIISGISFVANKIFVVKVDPLFLTALRGFIIGILFFIIAFYFSKSEKKSFNKISWKYLVTIGLVGGGFAFWLFFSGLKLTLAGRAAFIHKTLPIYATILAFIFLKEKITKNQIIAIVIMLFGLVLIEISSMNFNFALGDLMVLGATILWGIENTISKKALLKKESNWVVSFSRMFIGSLFLIAAIILLGKFNLLFQLTLQQILYISLSTLLLFLYVLTWYWGLKYINLSKASTILLLAPVISLVLGAIWLNEKVFLLQIIGSVLILAGAYIVARVKSETKIDSEI